MKIDTLDKVGWWWQWHVITVVKIVYSLYVSQVLHKNTGGGSGDVITVIAIDR